jgi:hypothetical protein
VSVRQHYSSTVPVTLVQVGTSDKQLVLRHDLTLDDSTNIQQLSKKGGIFEEKTRQTLYVGHVDFIWPSASEDGAMIPEITLIDLVCKEQWCQSKCFPLFCALFTA